MLGGRQATIEGEHPRRLRCDAETELHITAADATTPEGTFLVTTKVLGITTTYLFTGEPGDENSPIIGRIEYGTMSKPMRTAYAGSGIEGGYYLGSGQEEEDLFATMVSYAKRTDGEDV